MSRIYVPGETKGDAPIQDYNRVIENEMQNQRQAQLELWLSKTICEKLIKAYPLRHWEVMADVIGCMVIIKCPSLSLTKGYHVSMRGRTLHELQERAVWAAGEILERHNVTRGRVTDVSIFEHLPTTLRGDVIAPDAKGENPLKVVH